MKHLLLEEETDPQLQSNLSLRITSDMKLVTKCKLATPLRQQTRNTKPTTDMLEWHMPKLVWTKRFTVNTLKTSPFPATSRLAASWTALTLRFQQLEATKPSPFAKPSKNKSETLHKTNCSLIITHFKQSYLSKKRDVVCENADKQFVD